MTSYAPPPPSTRKLAVLAITIGLHVALGYALIHGLSRRSSEVAAPLVEAKIILPSEPAAPPKAPPTPPKPKPIARAPAPKPELPRPPLIEPAPEAPAALPAPPAAAAPPVPAAPVAEVARAPVLTPPVVRAASCRKPQYPAAAQRANETGRVLLSFLVDEAGKVIQSRIERSSGHARLDEAARAALALCDFRPATLEGKPTRAWARLEYVWDLE